MIKVKCEAATCIYFKDGTCEANEIELIDFEYYLDADKKEKDYLDDDMKCITYQCKYKVC